MTRWGAGVLLGAVLTLGTASAASAAGLISVSDDGVTFTQSTSTQLFAGAGPVVPGDDLADSVWVRSDASETGHLRLDIINQTSGSSALSAALELTFAADGRTWSVPYADVMGAEDCYVAVRGVDLRPGQTLRIDARLSVDPALGSITGTDGQRASVSFDVRAVLSDATVDTAVFPGSECELTPEAVPSVTPSDALSVTGAAGPWAPLAAGGVALLVGAALIATRRSRRPRHAS